MTKIIPEVDCKFCGEKLMQSTAPINIISETVNHLECAHCPSPIRNFWRPGFISRHEVRFYPKNGSIDSESIILDDGIHVQTSFITNKTVISEYRHGGPMEIELFTIITMPMIDVRPAEPNFRQRLKVWLTFS